MASHIVALVLYAALTLAMTWPLAAQIGDVVPHDLGDPLLSTWTLWWNAQVTPFTERWWHGMAFYPARYTLTLSDHRVGLGLITSPLIWSGVSPLAAHNVAFLATFFLSAAAAYALCFVLTRRAIPALVGGLVYGFNPFRAEHLPHLELLASYWLPIVFLALHQWVRTRHANWLLILSVALLGQAFTCGYYFFYAGVLVALWLLWFLPRDAALREYAQAAAALALPLVIVAPILLTYRAAHASMGLARSIVEIEAFSADLIGLVTPPNLLALWNTPREWLRAEGAIFPGSIAVLLILAALARRESIDDAGVARRWVMPRRALVASAILMIVVALLPVVLGPVEFTLLGTPITISAAYKPFTVAVLLFTLWLLTSPGVALAWRHQTPFAFYLLATVAMWVLALGPTARLLGERVLYKAPYAWLMLLPGFRDGFRVPARFAMLAALALSVAAALGFSRLFGTRSARTQLVAGAALAIAIVAESWIVLPLVPAPAPLVVPHRIAADAAIAELPFGAFEDAVAMYHAIDHRHPTVNGMSGYDPPHHSVLRAAIRDGAYEALSAVAGARDVAVFIRHQSGDDSIGAALTARTGAYPVAQSETHDVYVIPRTPPVPLARSGAELHIQHISGSEHAGDVARAHDADRSTAWVSDGQQGDEWLTADLGAEATVTNVVLESGGHTIGFPRAIAIEVSSDARFWQRVWSGPTASLSVAAALREPLRVPLTLGFSPVPARYVRVAQVGRSQNPWAVAELVIAGTATAPRPRAPR